MVLNQQPAQWTYGGRKLEYVERVGSTGGSTGPHLHGELRDADGNNPKDWSNTEAASNVFYQKPDGSIDRLYQPDKNGKIRLNPSVAKTSNFGMRIHPITGEERFHYGGDYGLPEGTRLFVPRDILTGSFKGFNDPKGYGNAVDIPTKFGNLRFAHLKGPANKLTIGEPATTTDSTQTAAASTSTPAQTPAQASQKIDGRTIVNLAFNLGKKEDDEENNFLSKYINQMIASTIAPQDFTKLANSIPNYYGDIG